MAARRLLGPGWGEDPRKRGHRIQLAQPHGGGGRGVGRGPRLGGPGAVTLGRGDNGEAAGEPPGRSLLDALPAFSQRHPRGRESDDLVLRGGGGGTRTRPGPWRLALSFSPNTVLGGWQGHQSPGFDGPGARASSGWTLPPCPQGCPWEQEPGAPASISAEGVGLEQSSPSLDAGFKYPPGPLGCRCCLTKPLESVSCTDTPPAWILTWILSLAYRPIHIPARPLCAMGGPRVLLAALWALGAAGAAALRVGAFNIQSFGDSKVSDPACGGVIAQILAGYDITLVQEVRDPDLSAVSALMEQINSVSRHEYSFVSSEPLGRDQYKEMYLFVYRKDAVSVVDTYQYPDLEDAFSREPFVVKFSAPGSAAGEFVLIPLHAAPHRAVSEIDALYDVYLDVIDKWGTDDLLFLGDFNADCNYVRERDWPSVRLRSSEVFKWLIPDSADTTVGNSDCAYDRIVACGARLRRSLKPQSAAVHDFQEEFGLDQAQALAISDHFPVEVTLKSH